MKRDDEFYEVLNDPRSYLGDMSDVGQGLIDRTHAELNKMRAAMGLAPIVFKSKTQRRAEAVCACKYEFERRNLLTSGAHPVHCINCRRPWSLDRLAELKAKCRIYVRARRAAAGA